MTNAHRSGVPINLSLEVFGDKRSLLILRDMIFGGRRHFRELLNGSQEGIASNILQPAEEAGRPGHAHQAGRPRPQAEGDLQADRAVDRTRADHGGAGDLGTQVAAGQRGAIDPGAQPMPGSPLLISSAGWRRSDCLVCRQTQRG